MRQFIQKNKKWLFPVVCMAILTPFTPMLDMAIASYFYKMGSGTIEHFVSHPLFDFLYVYALVPGQITAILAALALIMSHLFKACRSWRPHALVLVLTVAVGAGFTVHVLLKDHWGRPRPKQVITFGGQQEFRPFYKPNFFNQPEPSKSFPCGHCTMGFYFFSVVLMGIRFRKKTLFYGGIALVLLIGTALSITRMAQGGHFLSDILMSALIMWLTALTFDWMVYEEFA